MVSQTLTALETARLALRQPVSARFPEVLRGSAIDIARCDRPELPVLCFSPSQLAASAESFLSGFPGCTSFAVKSNSSASVIAGLADAGIDVFDVASCEEMAAVRAISPAARFHYHNPVKSRREIETAYHVYACRRYAVDCIAEIEKIRAVLPEASDLELAVRFRLPAHGGSAHDFSTKFGATPKEAVALLQLIRTHGLDSVLTFHPGSQCTNPAAWQRYIEAAAGIAATAGVTLKSLNVGGGFPARYLNSALPERQEIFDVIAAAAHKSFAGKVPALECEPGRGLVATAQSVLTRIKLVKTDRFELFLNDGIYGSLMEVSQAKELMPPYRAIAGAGQLSSDLAEWIVYGPTCDPLDVLPVKLSLPADISEGDYVEFGTIGAYGTATATGFNGYGQFRHAHVEHVLTA